MQKFGDLLKEIRASAGMNIAEAAQLIGYDRARWSRVEMGKAPPPKMEILYKWLDAFGIARNSELADKFIDSAEEKRKFQVD